MLKKRGFNIFIPGGMGFIGSEVSKLLLNNGHKVTAVGLSNRPPAISHFGFQYLSKDLTQKGEWQRSIPNYDFIINLAGQRIDRRWTQSYKKKISDSRILVTRNIVDAFDAGKPMTLINASAVGYYGNSGETTLTESSPPGDDFLAHVARNWENEAVKAKRKGVRYIIIRLGMVLGKEGGVISKLNPLFKTFRGGSLGDGVQWMSWIHIHDLMSVILFFMNRAAESGIFNVCAPFPVRNKEFTKTLGDILKRPSPRHISRTMIRLVLGEFGQSMLFSQKMTPQQLLNLGFEFKFPEIRPALVNLLK